MQANISERRLERLVNPTINDGMYAKLKRQRMRCTPQMVYGLATVGLPAFLAYNPGLDSGFMIAHCTAAALASENKVLVLPLLYYV